MIVQLTNDMNVEFDEDVLLIQCTLEHNHVIVLEYVYDIQLTDNEGEPDFPTKGFVVRLGQSVEPDNIDAIGAEPFYSEVYICTTRLEAFGKYHELFCQYTDKYLRKWKIP